MIRITSRSPSTSFTAPLVGAAALLLAAGCSSSSAAGAAGAGGAAADGPVGGPVQGAADAHCGARVQATSEAACHPTGGAGGASGMGGSGGMGGASTGAGGMVMDEGATMFGVEGDDDDCKYHVKWASTALREASDATFTITLVRKVDGAPATDAAPVPEVFLDDTHGAPASDPQSHETAPGVYTLGPVRFDAPGDWTVRFHFYSSCLDGDESPHGHAAFFVHVP